MKMFDEVVFTDDVHGFKKGEVVVYARDTLSSGYTMAIVIHKDKNYERFLKEENASNLEEYLNSLRKNVLFMNEDGWHQRFNHSIVYKDTLISKKELMSQIAKSKETIKEENEKLRQNEELLKSFTFNDASVKKQDVYRTIEMRKYRTS